MLMSFKAIVFLWSNMTSFETQMHALERILKGNARRVIANKVACMNPTHYSYCSWLFHNLQRPVSYQTLLSSRDLPNKRARSPQVPVITPTNLICQAGQGASALQQPRRKIPNGMENYPPSKRLRRNTKRCYECTG